MSLVFLLVQTQVFSLEDCIEYALEKSTDIDSSQNNVLLQTTCLEQSKASRLPNLQLCINQQLTSNGNYNNIGDDWYRNTNTTINAYFNSQISLYNSAKIKNIFHKSNLLNIIWEILLSCNCIKIV